MRKIDYIVAAIFIILIGLKIYLLPDVVSELKTPTPLYILGIVNLAVLFISLCFIRLKIRASRILIGLFILIGYFQTIWQFNIGDVGMGFLLLRLFGYTFFGIILFPWAINKRSSLGKEL